MTVDGFATDADMRTVIDAFTRCRFKHTSGDGGFFGHRVMWASHYPAEEEDTKQILWEWALDSRPAVAAFFDEPEIYCDGIQTVIWPENVAMPPHQDDRHPDPNRPHPTPWRFIASVLYLNDEYEGGEIYFPDQKRVIKPVAGQLIAFPGAWWHGVNAVTKGQRYTAPAWFSRDPANEDAFLKS